MPTFELEEGGLIEEDQILEAEVVSIEQKKMPFQNKETGADVFNLEFKFLIDEPDNPHDGSNLWGKTGTKFTSHPDCKLKNWAQEILVADLEVGYVLDTDILIGHKCRVVVGIQRWEDKATSETRSKNIVKDVIRSRTHAGDEGQTF